MNGINIEDDTNFEKFSSQAQNIHYNEPYIFEVANQITLNVHSTLEPMKNYTIFLKNHFECFLEFQEGEFLLHK